MKKILFVCLGNICRSSSAEEVMRTLIRKEGLEREIEVDSAGILSYHQGELPDSRMRMHASRRGYNLTHRSRPVCTDDFYHFDMIIGMDDRNIEALIERAPDLETEKKIRRMTDYCRVKMVDYVPDPYYGGAQGFENVLDILEDACAGLLESIRAISSTQAISLKVIGHSLKNPSATCASMILSTKVPILSSVYSGRLREAASTESAIIRMACSLVNGLGPG